MATVETDALGAWVREYARAVTEHRDELTELDSAIGDADHGTNMHRGMTAAVAALDASPPADGAALLKTVAMTMISKVGGTSGPLYGTLFLRMSGALDDGSPAAFAAAFRAGVEGVVARGKAELQDKTMVDALLPAADALTEAIGAGQELDTALRAAADAAARGRDSVTPLVARKGRASYLGERSADHVDPGAESAVLLVEAAAATLGRS
ncbi:MULTISPECIES: dihydroxyacetone kinase subunit DhaL [unclassified Modestobacter]|uniref:dihydroxyacetone kinase subunit DhaL n=1 Tax=unclassified Modestobacter TaxID=2643866 RepID=UPI0022AA0295|nr:MULTISPECIES: dihydroxyacetone kinase subunit DhaL [unclassified Modestobacter]MCZ2823365.1 dihydroxyacetone kinase subunit DhaL [Modestobacter sp. VKM Ac-2981]MCZ2851610.1 dihydroxyacetone kinase subunit DhaL [Modestobacter sp. VKM Ac-2982]